MMKKRKIQIIGLLILIIVLLAGCQIFRGKKSDQDQDLDTNQEEGEELVQEDLEDYEDLGPEEGGNIILPLTNLNSLNPLMTDNSTYYHFSKLIFQSLFEFDEKLQAQPLLVEEYSIENDGKTIALKLRDKVFWHDGHQLSTEDVAYTIEVIKQAWDQGTYGPMIVGALSSLERNKGRNIISSRIIDSLNMEINFNQAYSNSLEALTFPIISKNTFVQGGYTNYRKALELDDYHPIGTGPYKFLSYEAQKEVQLIKNSDYWDGPVYIEKITGKVLGDQDMILNAFETGQTSMAITQGMDWDKYRQNPRVSIIEFVGGEYEFLAFNFQNRILSAQSGKVIRQAMNYAINRDNIVETVYLTHASQTDLPIHSNSFLLGNNSFIYGYNPEKAKEILAEAGFNRPEGSKILHDQQGRPLSFRMATNSYNSLRQKTMEKIILDLANIGIEIQVEDKTAFGQDEVEEEKIQGQWEKLEKSIEKGDFDIVLLGWELSVISDIHFLYHSSQIKAGGNFINYRNSQMDQLIQNSLYASNENEKILRHRELQEYIIEDLPYLSLHFKNQGLLRDSKIKGQLKPSFYNFYRGLESAYIPKSLQEGLEKNNQ